MNTKLIVKLSVQWINCQFFFTISQLIIVAFLIQCIPSVCLAQNKLEEQQSIDFFPSELIALKGETLMDMVIDERKSIVSNSFVLYQNEPNPFFNETTISFELFEATALTLTIYDPTGKVLKEYKGAFAKGKNQIEVHGSELKDYGILYYQMTTPNQILNKKMIFKKPSKM